MSYATYPSQKVSCTCYSHLKNITYTFDMCVCVGGELIKCLTYGKNIIKMRSRGLANNKILS